MANAPSKTLNYLRRLLPNGVFREYEMPLGFLQVVESSGGIMIEALWTLSTILFLILDWHFQTL